MTDERVPFDAKVDYFYEPGYRSTAYLDSIEPDWLTAYGTNKYTDDPVTLVRDSFDDPWREAP